MSYRKVYQVITSDGFVAFSGSYKAALDVYFVLCSVVHRYDLIDLNPISVAFCPDFKEVI